tara:strand:- start:1592 stop:1822 length:231 start_codon:yes stop_codon:yes gene_type:complete
MALTGGRKKLDKNKDGEISGADFKMMAKGGAVSTEIDGVMQEHYVEPVEASLAEDHTGFSRGGGAALRGTRFRGVK